MKKSGVDIRLEAIKLVFTHAYSLEEVLNKAKAVEAYLAGDEPNDDEPTVAKTIRLAKGDKSSTA